MLLRCLMDGMLVPVEFTFGRAVAWDGLESFEFTPWDAPYYEVILASYLEQLEMDRLGLVPARWSGAPGTGNSRLPKWV